MAPKKRRRASLATLKHVPMSLMCEWGTCTETFSDMVNFTNHLKLHLTGVTTNGIMDEATEYSCLWRDCEMKVVGHVTDFVRHVYFHSFHIKIKHVGMQMVECLKLQGCQLDGQSHNLIPELPERLQCGWRHCETIMDIPEAFYRHVDSHALHFPEGNNVPGGCKCSWEGCDAVSKSRYKLREHLRSHTQEKVVACPNCGGLFSNRTKFLDHLKRQEETDVQCYQCSHCDKRYATERLLRDHVRHHVNQYKCPCCDMTCPTPSSLKSHLRYRHTTQTPYKCDHCGHGAKSLADLKKHLESHSMDVPYHCHIPECSYTSRTFQSLENHFKRIHQDIDVQKYKCHVCYTLFTRGSNLTSHLKKKHKFRWPSGHSRFRYKMHADGYWQLQTVRYESIKLAEQLENVQTQVVETSQTSSPESDESSKKAVKKRRLHKKEKENTACSSEPNDVVHNGYQYIYETEEESGIMIAPQGKDQCIGEASKQSVVHEPQTDTRYEYVTFVELTPQYLTSSDFKGSVKQVPHVPLYETLQPITVGSDGLDHTKSANKAMHYDITGEIGKESSSLQGSQSIVFDDTTENYNLEMLGDVALRAPLENKFSSPGRTRKRKQIMTKKCDEDLTVRNSNCPRPKSSRQLKLADN